MFGWKSISPDSAPRERLLWLPHNRITDYDDEDDYNEDEDDEGDKDDEDNEDNEDNKDSDDDENQFCPTQERLLWLPHNRIIASDEHLMFLFLDVMLSLTTILLHEE